MESFAGGACQVRRVENERTEGSFACTTQKITAPARRRRNPVLLSDVDADLAALSRGRCQQIAGTLGQTSVAKLRYERYAPPGFRLVASGSRIGRLKITTTSGSRDIVQDPIRILVVEDNADTLAMMALLLKSSGYRIYTASDGAAAITTAKLFSPDVVLLDLGLPIVDGFEACRQIKQLFQADTVPVVIAVTGWDDNETMERVADVGFDGHFTKPVPFSELVPVMHRLLSARTP